MLGFGSCGGRLARRQLLVLDRVENVLEQTARQHLVLRCSTEALHLVHLVACVVGERVLLEESDVPVHAVAHLVELYRGILYRLRALTCVCCVGLVVVPGLEDVIRVSGHVVVAAPEVTRRRERERVLRCCVLGPVRVSPGRTVGATRSRWVVVRGVEPDLDRRLDVYLASVLR